MWWMSTAFAATFTCVEQHELVLRDGGEWRLDTDFCTGHYQVLGRVDREGRRCWATDEHTSEVASGSGWGYRHVKVYCADKGGLHERASRKVEHTETNVVYAMEANRTGTPQRIDVAFSDKVAFAGGAVQVQGKPWRWWDLPGSSVERNDGGFSLRKGWVQYSFPDGTAPAWEALELVEVLREDPPCWLMVATEPDGTRATAALCGRHRTLHLRSYHVVRPDSVVESKDSTVRIDGEPWAWNETRRTAKLERNPAGWSLVTSGRAFPLVASEGWEAVELLGLVEARGVYGCWLLRRRGVKEQLDVVCPTDGVAKVENVLPVRAEVTVGLNKHIWVDGEVWPWDGRPLQHLQGSDPSPPGAHVALRLRSTSAGWLRCGDVVMEFDGDRAVELSREDLPTTCLVTIQGVRQAFDVRGPLTIRCEQEGAGVRCADAKGWPALNADPVRPSIPEAIVDVTLSDPGVLRCGRDHFRILGNRTVSIQGHLLPRRCEVLVEGAETTIEIRGSGSLSCSHEGGSVRCEPEVVDTDLH